MTLQSYMSDYLGELKSLLNWDDSNLVFPISETLSLYGVDTESDATDLTKLHAIAKVELWRAVLRAVSFKYNFSADGANFSRSQIYDMVKQNFEDAYTEAIVYLPNYKIELGEMTTEQNPYDYLPYYLRG